MIRPDGVFEVNRENLIGFFQRRPWGIPTMTVLDTVGLDTARAQAIIADMLADGEIELRGDSYFPKRAEK